MKSTVKPISYAGAPDPELVAACLQGSREAFACIVERYQRLLCSLAYSATGDLSESEDLAQEAFVTAWQDLGKLREPERLRSWLCGILRNRVGRLRRKNRREPVRHAGDLEEVDRIPSGDADVSQSAMSAEERDILWKTLEQVPETYREPLILYYREHRSVEKVAEALDLTPSAVKQRLTRGRKILQARVLSFVEGALQRSTPGSVFTAGVIAAIATLGTPGKAIAVGAGGTAAAKAGMTIKTTTLAAFFASIAGAISTFITVRAGLDQARTARERRATILTALALFGSFVGLVIVMLLLKAWAVRWPEGHPMVAGVSQVVVIAFAIGWPLLFARLLNGARRLRSAERLRQPEAFSDPRDRKGSKAGEYKSKATLFGIPLFHFRFAAPETGMPPVVGWIAGGDTAVGLLFAWGGWSFGFISVGAFSVGVISLGAIGIGLLSMGSIAVGGLALGAMAIGYLSFGSLSAMGLQGAAGGGFSLSNAFALGPVAVAPEANSEAAHAFFASPHANTFTLAFFVVVVLLTLVPATLWARAVRKRLGRVR